MRFFILSKKLPRIKLPMKVKKPAILNLSTSSKVVIMSAQLTINFGAVSSTLVKNSVKTFPLSKRFTKYMVKCSIFNILANRLAVNQADLKERHLETVPFFVLKRGRKGVKDPHFQRFLKWVDGIEDSIEQSFLKEVFLFMKDTQTNDVVESYKFKLKYNLDNKNTNVSTLSNENVMKQVLNFLKLVKQLGTQQKLDESTVVEIEFKYNEHTPFEYEPPGFKFADQPYCTTLIKDPFDINLGAITTGYHQLSCMGRRKITVKNENQNAKMTHIKKEREMNDIEVSNEDAETVKAKRKFGKRKILNISNVTVSIDDSIISLNSDMTENVTVQHNCICGQIDLPEVDKIYCFSCKNMLHMICCGFLKMPEFSTDYCCPVCDPNNTKTSSTLQDEARLRLVLYYMKKGALESILSLVPNEGYMHLKEANIIHEDNTVDEAMLQQLISVMFKEPNSQLLDA